MKLRKNSDHEKCHFAAEEMMEIGRILKEGDKDQETER